MKIRILDAAQASGATSWLTPTKAVILLSLRYKSDDHLWFSFFHEAGHILLHGKKDIFIEDNNVSGKEEEANRYASEFLIPGQKLRSFLSIANLSKESICGFATELGIAPGIVVGRLQHDGLLPAAHCNGLKTRLTWVREQ